MKTMSKRHLALMAIRLMAAWIFVREIIYLIMPPEALHWIRISNCTDFFDVSLSGYITIISIALTLFAWTVFGIWISRIDKLIASRVVPLDGKTGVDNESIGNILRLIIVCIGIQLGISAINDLPRVFRLHVTVIGSPEIFRRNGIIEFIMMFAFSTSLVLWPQKVLNLMQRFQKDGAVHHCVDEPLHKNKEISTCKQ